MYLSKTKKRNIIIFVGILLMSIGFTAFILLQKPKINMVQIAGSGYSGSELTVSVLPLDATVTYQWLVSEVAEGSFMEVPGATSQKLSLGNEDVGKFFKVSVKGTDKYDGSLVSSVFGPIKGVVITWPSSTPLTYGQALSSSSLGNGSALINGVLVPGTFTYETPDAIPTKTGNYKTNVIFTPTDLMKYKTISSSVNVVVNKAELTVTIDNINVVYGNAISDYTYSITGFKFTDDSKVISGTPNISSVYSPGLDISLSPMQIRGDSGTLASDNYSFKFVFGTITISKRTISVGGLYGNNKIYDGNTTATAYGSAYLTNTFPGDDVRLYGYAGYNFDTAEVGNNIRISVYGFYLGGSKAANYNIIQPTLSANINPVPIPVPTE